MHARVIILASFSLLVACGPELSARPDGGEGPPDGGGAPRLDDLFRSGELQSRTTTRGDFAGLATLRLGPRDFSSSITRDPEGRFHRRFEVHEQGAAVWGYLEQSSERLHDFALHPSGEVTLAVERLDAARDGFDLLRFDREGRLRCRQTLARPLVPSEELRPDLPPSPFSMRGVPDGSVVSGRLPWLVLEAWDEDVVMALLTPIDRETSLSDGELLSAVVRLEWREASEEYTEIWAHVLDGPHGVTQVAWQYDEFLWMDASARLLLSVDAKGVVVGRTLGHGRCQSLITFAEIDAAGCRQLRSGQPHRYQPFAFTRFTLAGERAGTDIYAPSDLDDLVIFDMAVSEGEIALAGTVVALDETGTPPTYSEPPGSGGTQHLPYDGHVAVLSRASGEVRWTRDIDLGRAEHLSALRFVPDGLVAAGASGWNRHTGGMSISRGSSGLLVWLSADGSHVLTREQPGARSDRHTHFLSLDVQEDSVVAVGPDDAPMTHSGDHAVAELSFGGVVSVLAGGSGN